MKNRLSKEEKINFFTKMFNSTEEITAKNFERVIRKLVMTVYKELSAISRYNSESMTIAQTIAFMKSSNMELDEIDEEWFNDNDHFLSPTFLVVNVMEVFANIACYKQQLSDLNCKVLMDHEESKNVMTIQDVMEITSLDELPQITDKT